MYLGDIWPVFVSYLGGICVWVVWFRSVLLQRSASIPLYYLFIKTEQSEGLKGPREHRFLPKFRPITQSTHRTGNDPPKSVFFYFLSHLKAKWAEIWSEDRFLIGGLGDFYFGHFLPFLAKKTKLKMVKFACFYF